MQHTLNQYVKTGLRTKCLFLELFVRKNKQKLAAIAHPDPRGGKSRQKPSKMPEICLSPPKNGPRIPKSRPKIVYQGGQIKCPQLQKPQLSRCDFSKLSIFPPSRRRSGRLRHECSRPAGSPKTASILPLLQVWPNDQLAFLLQLAGPCEHLLQNRRHSSAC